MGQPKFVCYLLGSKSYLGCNTDKVKNQSEVRIKNHTESNVQQPSRYPENKQSHAQNKMPFDTAHNSSPQFSDRQSHNRELHPPRKFHPQFYNRWSASAAKERKAQETLLWSNPSPRVYDTENQNSYRKRSPVFGTKSRTNKSIAGQPTPRQFSAFVGGVHPDVTEQQISEYMEQEIGIKPISITSNKRNKYNQSFKVTIQHKDKNSIFNSDAWDSNIIIKAFRERQFE